MPIVILPGQKDPQGLTPLRAIQVRRVTPLDTFIKANQTTLDQIQAYNSALGENLPSGLWLLVPKLGITPTPVAALSSLFPTTTPGE
jgi:hypothetical protein